MRSTNLQPSQEYSFYDLDVLVKACCKQVTLKVDLVMHPEVDYENLHMHVVPLESGKNVSEVGDVRFWRNKPGQTGGLNLAEYMVIKENLTTVWTEWQVRGCSCS